MIHLSGGPSHLDMYDMKPQAPVEYRGEFRPIRTNVPGIEISELMPRQATIADKFAILRGAQIANLHTGNMFYSGYPWQESPRASIPGEARRPAVGSVVSRLEADAGRSRLLPAYVQLDALLSPPERLSFPAYLGAAHKPFVPGKSLKTLELLRGVSAEQLRDRKQLLRSFDSLRRELDAGRGNLAGADAFTAQAMDS